MNQHRFDPLSFVFGALFVMVGLLLLGGGADGLPMQWVGPLVAVLLGVVILFAARPRRPPAEDPTAPVDDE
ncbi:MAG: hypothetical protein ABI841_04175 [Chloroflexota bacterium]